jgi:hypothetical protein
MEIEYDRFKWFGTMKLEFLYLFESSIVLDPIVTWRTNSSICGSSIGPNLLVPCCVKGISIQVISGI